eukprot:5369262-Amphidinium_carterae.1
MLSRRFGPFFGGLGCGCCHRADGFENFKGCDQDEKAKPSIMEYSDLGYLGVYPDWQSCRQALGCEPCVSRFGVLVQEKEGRVKRRVILGAERSGVSDATHCRYRVELPRATDVVSMALHADSPAGPGGADEILDR